MKNSIFLFVVIVFASCGGNNSTTEATETKKNNTVLLEKAKGLFQVLPLQASADSIEITAEKVLLGKTLFYDVRLSKNNTQSCNTCHNLNTFGVDKESTSTGDLGKNGNRNSPTVFNAALHFAQFWDGRAKSLEEQAGMPITNPVEMNMPNKNFVVDRLKKIKGYKKLFDEAFPMENDAITYTNLEKAIGAFERTLITPGKFDAFLNGDSSALSAEELIGLNDFIEIGCTSCHNGNTVGGKMFQKFPVYGNEYVSYTNSKADDLGKMEVSKDEFDRHMFKVPSLLNVSETGPYLHDGSVTDLGKVIKIMAKLQLNKDITDGQIKSIKTFLNTLKGSIPVSITIPPTMPN